MASPELAALFAILPNVAPEASTACIAWTAHALRAHLAAGAKERADLIEEKLAGRPERATKAFAEREAVFRAMHDEELRAALSCAKPGGLKPPSQPWPSRVRT